MSTQVPGHAGQVSPPITLRQALLAARALGEPLVEIKAAMDPMLEIATHYRKHFATSPATARGGDEPMVMYRSPRHAFPILMGLFGSRSRNDRLLGAEPGQASQRLARCLATPLAPVWTRHAPCHAQQAADRLEALPILTTTQDDAGPHLTSGVVCAGEPDQGFVSVSIHRMRVLDDHHLTIWVLPGRDLDVLYRQALARGRPLPISINLGVPPALYVASSLSKPFVKPGSGELETAGALLNAPLELARCVSCQAFCVAQSEIVIEGHILNEVADEFSDPATRLGMPEFLGYMGKAQAALPLIEVSGVFHWPQAIFQTFLGPGKEQSELLALPTEAGMILQLNEAFAHELMVLDAHYLAPGGGQLTLALRVRKLRDTPGLMARLRTAITRRHALTKVILLVDEDIDIRSPEDLLWALSTRFQPSRDLHAQELAPGFALDPSQAAGYLDPQAALTDKYLLDLSAPLPLRASFRRPW